MPYVAESLIIQESDHKLAALIYPDFEDAYKQGLTDGDIERVMDENRQLSMPNFRLIHRLHELRFIRRNLKRRLKEYQAFPLPKIKNRK